MDLWKSWYNVNQEVKDGFYKLLWEYTTVFTMKVKMSVHLIQPWKNLKPFKTFLNRIYRKSWVTTK